MNIRIKNGNVSGIIAAPSSKSYTQRYVLYSAFSGKTIKINNVSFSDDEIISLKIAESCNAVLHYDKRNIMVDPDFKCPHDIYVGESGTSYRLSLGLLSAKKCNTLIKGEPELARRPVQALVRALSDAGTLFKPTLDGFFTVYAENSSNKHVKIDGSTSSQFITAMLYYYSIIGTGSFTAENTVSENYVKITENCLYDFGIKIYHEGNNYSVASGDYSQKSIDIEGDYSSASYFIVLGIFTGNIEIKNLDVNSLQPDRIIVSLLEKATDSISYQNGKLVISKASYINEIIVDASISPDIAPVISVAGIFSKNGVKIYNYQRLKTKESDRWQGIMDLSSAYGASVSNNEEFIWIKRKEIKKPSELNFTDHRMIMSAIIAGIIAGSSTKFENIEKINKSYPEFVNDLKRIGTEIYLDANILK
ncbi:3-phosphoshikimate 1-carboxyvinyltransferase [Ferroplasma sp.]|uniref:3-phosphoshikimate 1-carboxyvinyltransferase n=1 Tax=Ferroplasma sp. TaxID=2591003 RepID=UPI00307F9C1B